MCVHIYYHWHITLDYCNLILLELIIAFLKWKTSKSTSWPFLLKYEITVDELQHGNINISISQLKLQYLQKYLQSLI